MKKMITSLVRLGVGLRMNLLALLLMMTGSVWGLDYYWVGGSGSWSDYASHWATSSGGNVFHDQVPTSMDNVYFDANSFPASGGVVSIDQTIIYCMNMDWTGATGVPVLTGPSDKTLWIYGSVRLIPQMSWTFSGQVNFRAFQGGKTIVTAGHNLGTVSFDGEGGAWTLGDGFTCRSFNLIKGSFDTDSKELRVTNRFNANLSSVTSLRLRSSVVQIGDNNYQTSEFNLSNGSVNIFDAEQSSIHYYSGSEYNRFTARNAKFNFVNFYGPHTLAATTCSFSKARFFHNSNLNGTHHFDTLFFSPGFVYKLAPNSKQTIGSDGVFTANGTCSEPVTIVSSSLTGIQATIEKNGAPVLLNYVVLRDIHTSGTASFSASSSSDLGNNTGWNITEATSRDLYWVGGAGDWNNPDRWALSSGGTPGNCMPTLNDNVFFDENSGFSLGNNQVEINVPSAFCKSMDWAGVLNKPIFKSDYNTTLYLKGGLSFTEEMIIDYYGNFEFISSMNGNTIQTFNHPIFGSMIFNGNGGEWVILDSLVVGVILHRKGSLNSSNQPIRVLSNFTSSGLLDRTLNISNTTIYLESTYSSFNIGSDDFNFNAFNTTIIFTSTVDNSWNSTSFLGGNKSYHKLIVHTNINIYDNNEFDYVALYGSAAIVGNNKFDTLLLSGNRNYLLGAGKVQTIKPEGGIITISDCSNFSIIKSNQEGSPAFIEQSSGTAKLYYSILQDIHTIGGAVFELINSADLGNNVGWSFSPSIPRNLYWVNGAGNWNDANHWSLSSGGVPGACIPTPYDNIFFDQYSGFTSTSRSVKLNGSISFCKDMNWTGITTYPEIYSLVNEHLYIYGSVNITVPIQTSIQNIHFVSRLQGNTINTFGYSFGDYVFFSGVGGEWKFTNDFGCYSLYHNAGKINTNGFNVFVERSFTSTLSSGVSLNFSNSTINVGNYLDLYRDGGEFQAGTSTIRTIDNFFSLFSDGFTFHNLISNCRSVIYGNNRFNAVTFNHSATLNGSNIFESLTLSPGRTYLFGTGQTQLITALGDFIAEGDGAFPIEVRSTTLGQQAFLYKDGDPICLDYLYLTDINASGSAFRYAGANSDDVANNSGLLFEACPGCFAATPGPAPVLDPASVTTVASGTQATLSVMEIPAGFQLIWLNQTQTQELYAGTDITFRPAVQTTTTFYAAFRDLSTGCVSNTLAVTVFACPAPTILSGVFTGETTASLSWRSNELPENNCWTLSLGNVMMSSCTDEANAVFQTTICYQQGDMVFSYPVIGATIEGQVITVEVADLQAGSALNWFVSEACDGIAAPYDVSGCAGPGDVDTVNDQFTIMTSTVPVTEAFDHPNYTPNGTISVKINNGTCVGTYSISISAINESGPGGSTPPNPANSPRIGVGQGTYVFQEAGIGRYIVTVSQTGICSPTMNPIRDTVTVGSVAGSIPFVLYVSDAEGNLLADTDPFTSTDNSYNFDTLAMLAGTCGRSDRLFVQVLDNTGSTLSTPGLVTASMTALLQSALPTVNISLADDGRFALDVQWVTGLNSLFINGNDNAGNIAELSFSATITDTEPPVLSCTPDTVVFNGQASIALVQGNLVSISDNCSSGAAIQTTSTLQSVSCAQLGQLLPVGFVATDGNGNSASCVSQVYVSGLPCGWSSDPGGIGCNSAASYQPGTGLWTLNANQCYSQSPYTSDSLAYAWKTLCGDGSITAAVMSLNDINGWAGITMRESAQAGSKKVQLTTNRHSHLLRREIRSVHNGQAFPDVFPSPPRHWLRLVRSGNKITGYASSDGQSWHFVMDVVVSMNQCIQVGLVAHGINRNQQVTATFAQVSTSGLEVPPLSGGEMPQASVAPYDMAVYPNPTEGMVQLSLPEDMDTEATLEVLDMRGQVLMSRRMRVEDGEERLDMRGYPNGMYWLRLSAEGRESVSKRIVIQR